VNQVPELEKVLQQGRMQPGLKQDNYLVPEALVLILELDFKYIENENI